MVGEEKMGGVTAIGTIDCLLRGGHMLQRL